MSTLRVSNIEAKADPSSPTVNEKVKITNSNGDVMFQLDGATSGITTVGINTTTAAFTVDGDQNFNFVGIVTAASFGGSINSTGISTISNVVVGGATTEVVVTGSVDVSSGVSAFSGSFTTLTASSNSGFHVDGGAPASSFTVNSLGDTVVGSGHSLYLTNGNLVFSTSGTGIDFSATGGPTNGTGGSELLDDYEEGTFTPTFTAGTVSGGYTRQVGEYTKVGRLVTFTLTIDGNGNLQGAAQALEIGGLPFTSRNVAEIGGAQITYPGDFDTTNDRRFWLVAQNNTTLSYRSATAAQINGNLVNNVNSQLNLCGYYFTDS